MSGPTPRDEIEATGGDVLAGEYVLGLLDADAARLVEQRARLDPAMAAAIAQWQDRFDPLADLAAPAVAGDATWDRIAASLHAAHTAPKAAPSTGTPSAALPTGSAATATPPTLAPATAAPPDIARPEAVRPGLWRAVALASMALAACLGALLYIRLPAAPAAPWPRAISLLSTPGTATAALRAQVTANGTITVVPLEHLTVAADRRLGFWAWPATEKAPVLLGLITPDGGQLRFPFPPREGTPVMVTLEKPGTAPGSPPGPTLYLGLLVAEPG
jgi:anti-sigma-K factor RskA